MNNFTNIVKDLSFALRKIDNESIIYFLAIKCAISKIRVRYQLKEVAKSKYI